MNENKSIVIYSPSLCQRKRKSLHRRAGKFTTVVDIYKKKIEEEEEKQLGIKTDVKRVCLWGRVGELRTGWGVLVSCETGTTVTTVRT